MPLPTVVATLIGTRQIAFGIACLRSLLRASADPIRLRIHDDGSLTGADEEAIASALGEPEIVRRKDADIRAATLAARYPRSLEWRAANPLALKLIDLWLYSDDRVAYCDADILFLRRFQGLFDGSLDCGLFMRDRQNAYSVRPHDLLLGRGPVLARRLNSGVIAAPRSLIDLDRIEWLLQRSGLRPAVWMEQTCWAMLAAGNCRLLEDEQFSIPRQLVPYVPDAGTIAVHYVGPVRRLLLDALPDVKEPVGPVVAVQSRPTGLCSAGDLYLSAILRRLGRG